MFEFMPWGGGGGGGVLLRNGGGDGHVTHAADYKNLNSEPDSLLKIKNSFFLKQLGNEIYNFEFMPRGGGD
jgi:hypothetical protein